MGTKRAPQVWIRSGDPLLIVTAGLLGALGGRDEFPQDRDGIEELIAGAAVGPDGERLMAGYEAPEDPITYLGGFGTWVGPAGEGRLRIRERADEAEGLASRVWILGPDGALGDPQTIEGYGVPEDELPATARSELEQIERRRSEQLARVPELQRRNEEVRNRFRLEHLRGVAAGPAGQDPEGPVVTRVVFYDSATVVKYLLPRPDETDFDPEEPWERPEVDPPPIALDDGLGTEFNQRAGSIDQNGEGPLRCDREFAPGVPAAASRLVIELDGKSISIELTC